MLVVGGRAVGRRGADRAAAGIIPKFFYAAGRTLALSPTGTMVLVDR